MDCSFISSIHWLQVKFPCPLAANHKAQPMLSSSTVFWGDTKCVTYFDLEKQKINEKLDSLYFYSIAIYYFNSDILLQYSDYYFIYIYLIHPKSNFINDNVHLYIILNFNILFTTQYISCSSPYLSFCNSSSVTFTYGWKMHHTIQRGYYYR